MPTLGEVLKRRRLQRGFSQDQLAMLARERHDVHISGPAISLIERNLTDSPTIHTILALTRVLGCTPDDILVEAGLLDPPGSDIVWSQPLRAMQRTLNLYPPGSDDRVALENLILAQAEAYRNISGREEDEEDL